ncbi:MAG TPA: MarR family transcriptional regulator [Solirubrobacteraceae bacterium]|jgi:DNA-binding MarR family transcriptional regulator|nr:MarR family transcriptional regulator [Solirubrobacteraceae bacterium]
MNGRETQIERLSGELLPRTALLTRLLFRRLGGSLSRSELGLLAAVEERPARVTALAELEGLAQPTMTLLVQRLEEQGLVRRERHRQDGRVVLVHLTEAGRRELERVRARAAEVLRPALREMPTEQLDALAAASESMGVLVAALQSRG